MIYIYALIDPRYDRVRYIGKTVNIKRRYEAHLYDHTDGQKNPRKSNWIKGLINIGLKPEIKIIETCENGEWEEREIYWIAYYRERDDELLNILAGGDSPETNIAWRNKRVVWFAKNNGKRVYRCYSCGGYTVSSSRMCNYCLRKLSNNGNDEWYKYYMREEQRVWHKDLRDSLRTIYVPDLDEYLEKYHDYSKIGYQNDGFVRIVY